jgi:hypothetical protein
MSLINDALKRAKQSQSPDAPPSAPHLHFRPVEPGPTVRRGVGLLLPAVLALIALVGLLFLWELAHKNGSTNPQPELVARAASTPPTAAPLAASQPPSVAGTALAAPATIEPAPAVAAPDPVEAPPATVADEAPAPPKPAPLRLQGIVFNPARPSAMINGKTVFVGEKVGEFRVGAITQNSATLISGSQTNLLELAE